MKYRNHKDLNLSEIGIGGYALSGVYGQKDVQTFRRMLARAVELGVNLFDTAEAYGDAERVMGEALKPYRDRVLIATKVGVKEGTAPNLSREYIRTACESSLKALQTETIDLYQVHFDDPGTPIEETVEALEALRRSGKIRHYGVGHLPRDRVETYLMSGEVFSVLMELSAAARSARTELLPLCQRYGTGAIAFSATGRGLLAGKIQKDTVFEAGDIRTIDPLFQRERFRSGLCLAEKLAETGRKHGKTPAQVAIAWVLAQPGLICALTGPSTIPHLEENLEGSDWVIPKEDLLRFEAFLQQEEERLRQEQQRSIYQIITRPLSIEASKAFTDLVYAMETGLDLRLASEDQVVPMFRELLALRKGMDEEAQRNMERLQKKLREMIFET